MEDRWLKTAYAYMFIRNFARALDVFRKAIEDDPVNPRYHFHASITALRSGLLEEAEQWAETAVALEPENATYRQHLDRIKARRLVHDGLRLLESGKTDEARECFDAALRIDPFNQDAIYFCSKIRPDEENCEAHDIPDIYPTDWRDGCTYP
jgi:tetratricopeptide (TPR) repeat protein